MSIRLMALGDVAVTGAFHDRFVTAPLEETISPPLLGLLRGGDVTLANVECVLTNAETFAVPGYGLRAAPAVAERLREAGVTHAGLANNHIRDVGDAGVRDTLCHLRAAGIVPTGAGETVGEAAQPLVVERDGVKIGILAVAEREYNLATREQAGAAPFEPLTWGTTIRALHEQCDVTLVFVHAGHEFAPVPSPRIRAAYRAAVDAGADAVIGHHPHVVQGVETYRGAPIFHSLGNFCFDSAYVAGYNGWQTGLIAELELDRSGLRGWKTHLLEIERGRSVRLLSGPEEAAARSLLEERSALLDDEAAWTAAWEAHVRWRAERDYLPRLDRLQERLASGKEPLLPRILRNYFQCPTHVELLETWFALRSPCLANAPDA